MLVHDGQARCPAENKVTSLFTSQIECINKELIFRGQSFLFPDMPKLLKFIIHQDFPKLWSQMYYRLLWFTVYKLHVRLCRCSEYVDLPTVRDTCVSFWYCNRLRCVNMLVVWFSVGDLEFVETVEIWRVWTFGTLQRKLRPQITDNKSPLTT